MDESLTSQRISVAIHTVAAVIMGYLSMIISAQYRALFAIILGFIILFVVGFLTEKIVKEKKGVKWWIANGGFIYILIWAVMWILFYNIAL